MYVCMCVCVCVCVLCVCVCVQLCNYCYFSYAVSIQIHFTGQAHWVTSAYIGGEVNLYDSCVDTKLTRSLMLQLKQIYEVAVNKRHLRVNEMPVQANWQLAIKSNFFFFF